MKKISIYVIVAVILAGIVATGTYIHFKDNAEVEDETVYTVNFDTNGGTEVQPINVKYGKEIGKLPLPYLEDYHLEGWFLDDRKYTSSSKYDVKDNITLKAEWTENQNITLPGSDAFEITSKLPEDADISITEDILKTVRSKITDSGNVNQVIRIDIAGQGLKESQNVKIMIPYSGSSGLNDGDTVEVVLFVISTGEMTTYTLTVSSGFAELESPSTSVIIGLSVAVDVDEVILHLDKTKIHLEVGETVLLKATVSGNTGVEWISSDETVATVNSNGKVTAIKDGTAVVTASSGGESDGCIVEISNATGIINANVYLDIDGSGFHERFSGYGKTFKEIVKNAVGTSHTIEWNASGTIKSVDGIIAGADEQWATWKWGSPSWDVVSPTSVIMYDGITLAISLSEKIPGTVIKYSKPQVDDPMYTAYFYIEFREYDSGSSHGNAYADSVVDKLGTAFWIVGEGSDVSEAFTNAIYKFMFSDEYSTEEKEVIWYYNSDRQSNNYGWFWSFCGLSDTLLENGDWLYWVQYTWEPELSDWNYNQSSLGSIDVTENDYFAIIFMATSADELGSGLTITPEDCDITA